MSKLDKSLDEIIKANRPVRTARTKNRRTPFGGRGSKVRISNRLYVGNLSWETDWTALKDYMRKAGPVNHVDVMEYPDGRSKGCAIVEFESVAGAKKAIATLNDTNLDGRPIFVREDRESKASFSGSFNGSFSVGGRGAAYDEPVFSPNSNMAQKIRNKAPQGCTVYVGNLPYSAEWQEVKDICSKFGTVGRADVEQDENGQSKGYGIVVFENAKDARNCIQGLDGAAFGDRELTVKLDKIRASGQIYDKRGSRNFGGTGKFEGRLVGGPNVFIGNLPWSVEWQDLKDLCRQYGNVKRADVPQDASGRSKGFGIVTFATPRDAKNCIENLNGMLLDGRDLNVRYDRES